MGKSLWILSGAVLAVLAVSLLGFASAHFNAADQNNTNNALDGTENNGSESACPMHSSGSGMMNGMSMAGMHSDSDDTDNDNEMSCGMHSNNGMMGGMGMMQMMHGMDMHECMNMSIEEMDSDNDGKCDYCGMSIEECSEMKEEMGEHHNEMHGEANSDNDEMSCGMHSHSENNGMQSGMMGMQLD